MAEVSNEAKTQGQYFVIAVDKGSIRVRFVVQSVKIKPGV